MKAIITVGLGFGDEGKGAWVDYLVRKMNAGLVVRYSGGSQCGHNVSVIGKDGSNIWHTFSQFGSGTLAGVPTYLGRHVIINPTALYNESQSLKALSNTGLWFPKFNPVESLMIDPKCLVSTIYHQRMNKVREIHRGRHRHGSCGHGIGETRSYWLKYGDDAIFAGDLYQRSVVLDKLELCRQRLRNDEYDLLHDSKDDISGLLPDKAPTLANVVQSLERVFEVAVVSRHMPSVDTIIFEGAQGVLLDEFHGFRPHVTWSTVTPEHAWEFINPDVDDVTVLGVTRTYMTRHGAGPLPTYNIGLTNRLIDKCNPDNLWQGHMRCGWLDVPLLEHAIKACERVDGILVSHMDQITDDFRVRLGATDFDIYDTMPNYIMETGKKAIDEALSNFNVVGRSVGPTHLDRTITI